VKNHELPNNGGISSISGMVMMAMEANGGQWIPCFGFHRSSQDFFHDLYLLSKRAMKKKKLYLLNKANQVNLFLKKNYTIYFRCILKAF
jgi:hypothetical protein